MPAPRPAAGSEIRRRPEAAPSLLRTFRSAILPPSTGDNYYQPMFELRLRARRLGRDRITLHLPILFRIAFIAVGLFLILGMMLAAKFEVGATVIVAVCILGALYDERWDFDATRRVVARKIGVLFLHGGRSYAFDDITSVSVRRYQRFGTAVRGPGDRRHTGSELVQLGLDLTNGATVVIETRKVRSWDPNDDLARSIAEMCETELIEPED